jgi:hypothetical protein
LARDHIFSCATTKAAVVIRASAISRALLGIKQWAKAVTARHCERSEAIQSEMLIWIASSLSLLAMTKEKRREIRLSPAGEADLRAARASSGEGINISVLKPPPPVLKADCSAVAAMTMFQLKRLVSWSCGKQLISTIITTRNANRLRRSNSPLTAPH